MSRFLLLIAAVGLLFIAPASAHSALESSVPANGATVAAPKTVMLTFSDAVRLVTLKLTAKDVDVSLPVDRAAPAAKTFSVALPAVAAAKYDVNWTAAADDGHAMTGTFSFTVVVGPGPKGQH